LLQWGADHNARNAEELLAFHLAKDFPMRWVTFHGKMYAANWLYYYVSDSAVKGWNRYWAVLTIDMLYLHNQAPSHTNIQGITGEGKATWTEPAKLIKLQGAQVRLHLKNPIRRNSFELQLPNDKDPKVFSISDKVSSEDETMLHVWVERLRRRIAVIDDPKSIRQTAKIEATTVLLNELHAAAKNGDINKMQTMIKDEGRDPNYARGYDGRTPLHIASKYNHLEVVELLLSCGAKALVEDKSGWTAIHVAAWMGHIDILSKLLPTIASNRLWVDVTPIHRAAESNKANALELMLRDYKMFDVNAQESSYNETPLHLAARLGHAEAVETLLKYGARTNIKNKGSKTPAQVAATENIEKVLETGFNFVRNGDIAKLQEVLKKEKNALTKFNFQGLTMTHVAAQEGNTQ